ncbi:hypothetical protein [Streptomyces sp. DASNCL29]|uniref:hypothetical protein n=1 Tax=Streptomyces sp. DASNCL29 TaxID=2583819 RepID=UPI00110FF684|nr:hypothetical protein [Streptomyces sp. DASNCL29]TMU90720.1 hypothetical protein FGK60_45295 [Streptomyces sp. DASNCL29]
MQSDPKYVGHEEFLSIAPDPGVALLIKKQLEGLAAGKGGEVLKEMATDVLTGRIGLREAMQVPAYEEELVTNIDKFQRHWSDMSSEDRSQAQAVADRFLGDLRQEATEAH